MFCSPMEFSIPADVSATRGCGVAGTRLHRHALRNDGAERVHIEVRRELQAPAETAGSGHNRVSQQEAVFLARGEIDFEDWWHSATLVEDLRRRAEAALRRDRCSGLAGRGIANRSG